MRIRSIKPDFWRDRVCARWSTHAKLLYIGLWNIADDEGRFEWEPELFQTQLFPFDPHYPVKSALGEISARGQIVRYEVGVISYGFIPSFKEHQHPKKPSPSTLPPPPANWGELVPPQFPTGGGKVPPGEEGRGGERKGRESRGEENSSESETAPTSEPAAPPTPFVVYLRERFPTLRKPEVFERAAREAYPGIDPLAEARKAHAWEVGNPKRRKVDKSRFLHNWFARAQDALGRGRNRGPPAPVGVLPTATAEELAPYLGKELKF